MTEPVIVRSGRNPHTVALSVAIAFMSVYGLIFTAPSQSLETVLNTPQRIGFGVLALIGTVLILRGLYHRHTDRGLLLERIGQSALAVGAVFYAAMLYVGTSWTQSGLVIAIVASVSVGSAWRAAQITFSELPKLQNKGDE